MSLSATRRPASLPPGLPLIEVVTYQAPSGFSARRRAVRRPARIFHRRQLVRRGVERRIGIDERRDDLLGGAEIVVARIHAELVRGLAQVGEAGFLEHDPVYFGSGTVAGLLGSDTWMTRYLSGCVVEALRETACSAFGAS